MPLHAVAHHPPLPQRAPVALADVVLVLVVDGGVRRAVVHAGHAADDHVALEPAQHGAAHDGRPRVQRLHDLDGPVLADGARHGVRRPLRVRRRRAAREVALEPPVEVLALPEAAHEHDARHDPPFVAQSVYLALHQVAHLLDHRLEDVLDLRRRQDQEPRVQARVLVVGQSRESVAEWLDIGGFRSDVDCAKRILTGRSLPGARLR